MTCQQAIAIFHEHLTILMESEIPNISWPFIPGFGRQTDQRLGNAISNLEMISVKPVFASLSGNI